MTDLAEMHDQDQDIVQEIKKLVAEARSYKKAIEKRIKAANGGGLSEELKAANRADLARIEAMEGGIEILARELEDESAADEWIEKVEKIAQEARAAVNRWKSVAFERLIQRHQFCRDRYQRRCMEDWEIKLTREELPRWLGSVLPAERERAQQLYSDIERWLGELEQLNKERAAARAEKQAHDAVVPAAADADSGAPAPIPAEPTEPASAPAAADADGGAPMPVPAEPTESASVPAAAAADGGAPVPVQSAEPPAPSAEQSAEPPPEAPTEPTEPAPVPVAADADGDAPAKLSEAEVEDKLQKLQRLCRVIDKERLKCQDFARHGFVQAIEQAIKDMQPTMAEIERLVDEDLKGSPHAALMRSHARSMMEALDGLKQDAERVLAKRLLKDTPLATAFVEATAPSPGDLPINDAVEPTPADGDGDASAPTADAPSAEQPAQSAEQPAPSAELPAPSAELPASTAEQPAPSAEQPAPTAELSVPLDAPPAPSAEPPAPSAEPPAPSTETPVPLDAPPVLSAELPAPSAEQSAELPTAASAVPTEPAPPAPVPSAEQSAEPPTAASAEPTEPAPPAPVPSAEQGAELPTAASAVPTEPAPPAPAPSAEQSAEQPTAASAEPTDPAPPAPVPSAEQSAEPPTAAPTAPTKSAPPAPAPASGTGQSASVPPLQADGATLFIPTLEEHLGGQFNGHLSWMAPLHESLPPKLDFEAFARFGQPNSVLQEYVEVLSAFAIVGIAQFQQLRAMLIQLEERLAGVLEVAERTYSFVDAKRAIELLGALRQALS